MNCPECARLRASRSAPLFLQLAARLVRTLPRVRRGLDRIFHEGFRLRSRGRTRQNAAESTLEEGESPAPARFARAHASTKRRAVSSSRAKRSPAWRVRPPRIRSRSLKNSKFRQHRRRNRQGHPDECAAPAFPQPGGTQLSHPGSRGEYAQRRRIPAHPPRGPAWTICAAFSTCSTIDVVYSRAPPTSGCRCGRLHLRHHQEEEAGDVDTALVERLGEVLRT